jgi:hypothetical protein
MTQTMKALFVVPGPAGGVNEFREILVPTPGPGEVLVAVRAAGTNAANCSRGRFYAQTTLQPGRCARVSSALAKSSRWATG